MKKQWNSEWPDSNNPEWTEHDIARARRASEVLPDLFGTQTAKAMLKPRGIPHAEGGEGPHHYSLIARYHCGIQSQW